MIQKKSASWRFVAIKFLLAASHLRNGSPSWRKSALPQLAADMRLDLDLALAVKVLLITNWPANATRHSLPAYAAQFAQ